MGSQGQFGRVRALTSWVDRPAHVVGEHPVFIPPQVRRASAFDGLPLAVLLYGQHEPVRNADRSTTGPRLHVGGATPPPCRRGQCAPYVMA
jgi:hypothetical protein